MFGSARYLAVLLTAVLCYAALGAVLGILPDYVRSLGGGAVLVGLAVGAPAIAGAAGRPLGGRLADRRGPARIMIGGAIVMAAGTIPAFVSSLPLLVLSRLVVGAGEAAMMAAALLWLLRLAGPARRGRAIGHIGLANYAGLTIGPPLSQALSGRSHADRVWVAAAVLPLLAAALAAALSGSPEGRAGDRRARERAGDQRARERGGDRRARERGGDQRARERGGDRRARERGGDRRARERGGDQRARERDVDPVPTPSTWRLTIRPGLGLMLVNVGYVALLSFGAAAVTEQHAGIAAAVIPAFGVGVIASRTVLAGVPDRFGAAPTLIAAVVLESGGLAALAMASSAPLALVALLVMAIGQGLAVPSLGLLALGAVPPTRHGRTAGAFFAYFDAGVGLGGPAVGLAAHAADAAGALLVASGTVLAAVPVALLGGGEHRGEVGHGARRTKIPTWRMRSCRGGVT